MRARVSKLPSSSDIDPHLTSDAQYDRALDLADSISDYPEKRQAVKAIESAAKSHH
jgi:hypothetical protein